ncbi:RdgB/HAM1 family non-canonical purine NTP pyrophosphatase [Melioribacteraceae bacterium 4301-Me]|uniref:RdgB/HAM1 family non-canonical purine NTP pyrophosphatase n=1 Tax=Pyranulibacter aquaticus TaxID=3163344 RepID=UPI00359AD819
MKLIFASQNLGKVKEVKGIFLNTPFEIVSLYDLGNNINVKETGSTFSENAFLKAKAVYDIYKEPVIADDSGLMIEQLNGKPGVFSARYAGENCSYRDNNLKVISELRNLPEPHRAKFVCVSLFLDGNEKIETIGELVGVIIKEERGSGGFGYDPIFIPDGFSKTIAELSFEEKNKISHRAKSFNKLKNILIEKFFC